jgi:hypothetical protein
VNLLPLSKASSARKGGSERGSGKKKKGRDIPRNASPDRHRLSFGIGDSSSARRERSRNMGKRRHAFHHLHHAGPEDIQVACVQH